MPTKTKPYILGRLITFTDDKTLVKDDEFALNFDVELLSVSVGSSRYYPTDNWSMWVGEDLVFENIYTKDLPEGVYLMAVIPIKAGTPLKFRYVNNEMHEKHVWFNYQFLR